MSLPIRYIVVLGAFTLAIGVTTGAAFLVSAHDASVSATGFCGVAGSDVADETPFVAENDAAMTKMMNDMAVKPTGDVDVDFVAMMVPHHQGAIDMALAVLRYGHSTQIRRLAQEIIVTQQEEIAAMRLAVGEPLPPSVRSPTETSPMLPLDHHSMSEGAPAMSPGRKMN